MLRWIWKTWDGYSMIGVHWRKISATQQGACMILVCTFQICSLLLMLLQMWTKRDIYGLSNGWWFFHSWPPGRASRTTVDGSEIPNMYLDVNSGIIYRPQLVSRISSINIIVTKCWMFLFCALCGWEVLSYLAADGHDPDGPRKKVSSFIFRRKNKIRWTASDGELAAAWRVIWIAWSIPKKQFEAKKP